MSVRYFGTLQFFFRCWCRRLFSQCPSSSCGHAAFTPEGRAEVDGEREQQRWWETEKDSWGAFNFSFFHSSPPRCPPLCLFLFLWRGGGWEGERQVSAAIAPHTHTHSRGVSVRPNAGWVIFQTIWGRSVSPVALCSCSSSCFLFYLHLSLTLPPPLKTHTSIILVRIQRLVTTLSGRTAKVLWKTCEPLELCSSPSRFLLLRHRNHSNQTTPDTITSCFWEQKRKRERSHLEHMASVCPQLCLYWQCSRSQCSHRLVLGKAELYYTAEQPRPAAFAATVF